MLWLSETLAAGHSGQPWLHDRLRDPLQLRCRQKSHVPGLYRPLGQTSRNTLGKFIKTNLRDVQKKEFNWTEAELGVMESSFFYGYMITQIPAGFLAAKFPANKFEHWIISNDEDKSVEL